MNKGIKIKQHDITDCGAACLASISAYYGLNLPISKIRQMASTDRKGTNVPGLIEAAGKFGFEIKAVKSKMPDGTNNVEPLKKIPTPTIAHVIKNGKLLHYEVIYSVKKDKIQIMDPGTGELDWCRIEDFNSEWTGILVLMMPKDDFEKGDKKVSMLARFRFPKVDIFVIFVYSEMRLSKFIILLLLGLGFYGIVYALAAGLMLKTQNTPLVLFVFLGIAFGGFTILSFMRCVKAYEETDISFISDKTSFKKFLVGIVLAIVSWAVYYLILYFTKSAVLVKNVFVWEDAVRAFTLYGVVAIGEEVTMRGIVFRLIDIKFNFISALIVSSFLFGFLHLPNPNASILSSIFISISAGLLTGVVFKYYNSIWPAIGFHWLWNFMDEFVFGDKVSGVTISEPIFKTDFHCSDYVSGGDFGPEGSVVLTSLVLIINIVYIILYLKKEKDA